MALEASTRKKGATSAIFTEFADVVVNGVACTFSRILTDNQAMSSNPLAVFVTSLPCTDEIKVVSWGTPRSLTQLTGGFE